MDTITTTDRTGLRCLLVGMSGGGGEEIFLRDLVADPPPGIEYSAVFRPHESVPGARARTLTEVAFNRLVQPRLWPIPGLRAYSVDERFDLVHVHVHPHHLRLPAGVPVVMSVSNSYVHYIRDYLGWDADAVDRLYRRAARILPRLRITNELVSWQPLAGISVFSRFARDVLVERGVPGERVTVIPPGFPVPPQPQAREAHEEFTFLFAGRDPRRKGADLVVDAVRRMRRDGVRVRALLVGDESFLELAGEDGFEVRGPVPRDVLLGELYGIADAFALPARAEGYGFTLVEAMSHGLPVVATTYGSIPEVVVDGETGLLVEPGDGRAVEAAMRALAADRAAARAMGAAGRRRFESEFTRPRFLEATRTWYDRALGEG